MRFRRSWVAGGCYFFTVVTRERRKLFVDDFSVSVLRDAFRAVHVKRPFTINAAVILPDHIHSMWILPQGDADYATRWRLIKACVTRQMSDYGAISQNRPASRSRCAGNQVCGRSVWQRRYWEHLIRDDDDYHAHLDYIHYNPVRHGYVARPVDWPYSSIHRYVADGTLAADWGGSGVEIENGTGRD